MSTAIRPGMRVVILGAARQGAALARFFAARGAVVVINDRAEAEKLAEIRRELAGLPVEWVTGGHPLELLDGCDLVCLSGGVSPALPIVQVARERGIPLTNDAQLTLELAPCPVVGITGSAGKTTTTTLVGRMAAAAARNAARPGKAWTGGNIGTPLIDQIDAIGPADLVVLELSSFQLELMTRSPQVASVLNLTPNHLDRHGTMEAYREAKQHILDFQSSDDIAVLGREDAGAWDLRHAVRGRLMTFGIQPLPAGQDGTWVQDERVVLRRDAQESDLLPLKEIHLPGRHNLQNVLAAAAVAAAADLPGEAIREGVQGFLGVPHRLEVVRDLHGVRWINDSIATAPERTAAAIHSFNQPLVLLLGGRDKNLPWEDLAALIRERVDHVVVFGESAPKILHALGAVRTGSRPYSITHAPSLAVAIANAQEKAQPGAVVLFSPGGTSYDEFTDFAERGEFYRTCVKQLS